jgi:ribose/xylose/arabinose/galactoside ABC-type transport system permease subunit
MKSDIESRSAWGALARALRPFLALALVCAAFSAHPNFRGTFWTSAYLPNVLQQSARNIVLAVGSSFVIFTGGIDLSVGAILALSGVGLAMGLAGTLPPWLAFVAALPIAAGIAGLLSPRLASLAPSSKDALAWAVFVLLEIATGTLLARGIAGGVKVEGAIALALLIGAGCGLVNGAVISQGRVPAFVMTLGMLSAARGLTLYATDGSSVRAAVPRFMALGQGLPLAGIVLLVVVAGAVSLSRTRPGRYIMSIGGNETATHLSGVPVFTIKTLAYVLSGMCAAIGAVIVTAKFGTADTNAGMGAELDAIAAVVIGGASLNGGQGSIVGALVGALTITIIESGLVLVGIKDTLQPVILGGVIVLTVYLDQLRRRSR